MIGRPRFLTTQLIKSATTQCPNQKKEPYLRYSTFSGVNTDAQQDNTAFRTSSSEKQSRKLWFRNIGTPATSSSTVDKRTAQENLASCAVSTSVDLNFSSFSSFLMSFSSCSVKGVLENEDFILEQS